jgi:hypothetical protein
MLGHTSSLKNLRQERPAELHERSSKTDGSPLTPGRNLPWVRNVLSSASNLMLPGAADVYPDFTRNPGLSADGPDPQPAAVVLRLARQAQEEYQVRV